MPWYNNEIDDARKKRRKAERKWRKSRRAEDLVMFKRLKNYVTHLINKARRDFYTEFVNENSSNQTNLSSNIEAVRPGFLRGRKGAQGGAN